MGGVWHRGLWTIIIITSSSSRSDRDSVLEPILFANFVTRAVGLGLPSHVYNCLCHIMGNKDNQDGIMCGAKDATL